MHSPRVSAEHIPLQPMPTASSKPQKSHTSITASTTPYYDIASFEDRSNAKLLESRKPPRRERVWWRRIFHFNGWRVGVSWCAGATATVLLINVIATISASAKYGTPNGIGTLQDGKCDKAKKVSLWLHFVINALSTTLLAASNYCMQCLSAPTREEVDKAHRKGKFLDIGVPSVRNLFHISRLRRLLWWLLAISGIPLHLLYNSAVFSTLASNQFAVYGVSEKIIDDPSLPVLNDDGIFRGLYNSITPADAQTALDGFRDWENLDKNKCLQAYGQSFVSLRSTLLVVSPDINATVAFRYVVDAGETTDSSGDVAGYSWICNGNARCDPSRMIKEKATWILRGSQGDTLVNYCLSKRVEEHCAVQFSVSIMTIVIVANAIKVTCMLMTLWRQRNAPLVTLGDALQSFLQVNDPTTEDRCLNGIKEFKGGNWTSGAQLWLRRKRFWFSGVSTTRWLICNIL